MAGEVEPTNSAHGELIAIRIVFRGGCTSMPPMASNAGTKNSWVLPKRFVRNAVFWVRKLKLYADRFVIKANQRNKDTLMTRKRTQDLMRECPSDR